MRLPAPFFPLVSPRGFPVPNSVLFRCSRFLMAPPCGREAPLPSRRAMLSGLCALAVTACAGMLSPVPAQASAMQPIAARLATGQPAVPIPVRRIIALHDACSDILLALGAEKSMVACTDTARQMPALSALPGMGDGLRVDAEAIRRLRPDLVLQIRDGRAVRQQIETLRSHGIPVLLLDLNSFEDLYTATLTLGRLTGKDATAATLVSQWRRRLNTLRNTYATKPAVRVFFEVASPRIVAAGRGNMLDAVISAAGGENVITSQRRFVRMSDENAVRTNPDVYILQTGRRNPHPVPLRERPLFRDMRAVREGRVLRVDESLFSRPGPRSVEAAELLGRWLHEDICPQTPGAVTETPLSGR